jgi:hypothetical protein
MHLLHHCSPFAAQARSRTRVQFLLERAACPLDGRTKRESKRVEVTVYGRFSHLQLFPAIASQVLGRSNGQQGPSKMMKEKRTKRECRGRINVSP